MKKYIHIAKCIRPVMTDEASNMIAEEYANLRAADFGGDKVGILTITSFISSVL